MSCLRKLSQLNSSRFGRFGFKSNSNWSRIFVSLTGSRRLVNMTLKIPHYIYKQLRLYWSDTNIWPTWTSNWAHFKRQAPAAYDWEHCGFLLTQTSWSPQTRLKRPELTIEAWINYLGFFKGPISILLYISEIYSCPNYILCSFHIQHTWFGNAKVTTMTKSKVDVSLRWYHWSDRVTTNLKHL